MAELRPKKRIMVGKEREKQEMEREKGISKCSNTLLVDIHKYTLLYVCKIT